MAGFIYIMSNPAFPNLLKIGKSKKDPTTDRVNELNQTGVPEPFKVEYYAFVDDEDYLEKEMHAEFASQRPNKNREFFSINCIEAIEAIRRLAAEKSKIKYEEVLHIGVEGFESFRGQHTAETQKHYGDTERPREEPAERIRFEERVISQIGEKAKQDEKNQFVGAWAISLILATVFSVIFLFHGAGIEAIFSQFILWPFLVFLLLRADRRKK